MTPKVRLVLSSVDFDLSRIFQMCKHFFGDFFHFFWNHSDSWTKERARQLQLILLIQTSRKLTHLWRPPTRVSGSSIESSYIWVFRTWLTTNYFEFFSSSSWTAMIQNKGKGNQVEPSRETVTKSKFREAKPWNYQKGAFLSFFLLRRISLL